MNLSLKQWLQYCIPLTILLGILLSNFFTQIALFEKWWDLNEITTIVDPAKGKRTEHVEWKPEEDANNSTMMQDSIGFGVAKKNKVAQWIRQGEYEKAKVFLEKKLKKDPSARNLSQLGIVKLNLEDTLGAKKDLLKAITMDSSRASSWLNLGLYYSRLSNQNKAIQQFTRALQLQPSHNEAQFNRGLTFYRQGLLLEALTDFNAIVARDGSRNWVKARYNAGLILLKQSQWDLAATTFKEVLRLNPIHLASRYNLGLVYMRMGNENDAMDQFEKVLRIDANHLKSLYNLAFLQYEKGMYNFATRNLQRSLKIDAKNQEALILMARILNGQKKSNEAIEWVESAINLSPNNPDWYLEKSIILQDLNMSDSALALLNQVLLLDSSFAPAYYRKGLIYEHRAEYASAIIQLKESVNLRPRHILSLMALSRVYHKNVQVKEAITQLTKVIKRDSLNREAFDLRYQCYMQLGEYEKAEKDLVQLQELNPKNIALKEKQKELHSKQLDREVTEE